MRLACEMGEAFLLQTLEREGLHEVDGAEVLVRRRGHLAVGRPRPLGRRLQLAGRAVDCESQRWGERQCQHGEHGVEHHHHADHADQQQHVREQHCEGLHDHVLRAVDVAGDAGGEVPDSIGAVVSQRQPVEVGEGRLPQTVGQMEPGRRQQPGGPVIEQRGEGDDHGQRRARQSDGNHRAIRGDRRRQHVVDHVLEGPRLGQAHQHLERCEQGPQRQGTAVGPHVGPQRSQPPHAATRCDA